MRCSIPIRRRHHQLSTTNCQLPTFLAGDGARRPGRAHPIIQTNSCESHRAPAGADTIRPRGTRLFRAAISGEFEKPTRSDCFGLERKIGEANTEPSRHRLRLCRSCGTERGVKKTNPKRLLRVGEENSGSGCAAGAAQAVPVPQLRNGMSPVRRFPAPSWPRRPSGSRRRSRRASGCRAGRTRRRRRSRP